MTSSACGDGQSGRTKWTDKVDGQSGRTKWIPTQDGWQPFYTATPSKTTTSGFDLYYRQDSDCRFDLNLLVAITNFNRCGENCSG